MEGRTIDHSTSCDFRIRFQRELKDLFRQIGRVAMHMGLIRLNQVALDGMRVKANSSRHATASAKTLEERLKALDEQIENMLAEADQVDQQDKDLFGNSANGHALPAELTDLKKRHERLRKAPPLDRIRTTTNRPIAFTPHYALLSTFTFQPARLSHTCTNGGSYEGIHENLR